MSVEVRKYDPEKKHVIREMTDEEITAAALSDPDNPPLTDEQIEHNIEYGVRMWELPGKNANEKLAALETRYPREKITFECDADVAAWLKAKDKYYRGRINRLLRKAMETGWDVEVSPWKEATDEEGTPSSNAIRFSNEDLVEAAE